MKLNFKFLLLFTLLISLPANSQNEKILKRVLHIGNNYIKDLRVGNIENLKNVKAPEDTWLFSRLEFYKKELKENYSNIGYGFFIQPSPIKPNNYGYNFYAYNIKTKKYYFVAVINTVNNKGEVTFDKGFLFTEKSPLKSWWQNAFSFYTGSSFSKIPSKFKNKKPPHPPFSE